MTNYNDGRWHGFSGGKMPVHAKSEVECFFSDGVKSFGLAGNYSWENDPDWIAFRVIKPYHEPREVYLKEWRQYSLQNGESVLKDIWSECEPDDEYAVLFREVIE